MSVIAIILGSAALASKEISVQLEIFLFSVDRPQRDPVNREILPAASAYAAAIPDLCASGWIVVVAGFVSFAGGHTIEETYIYIYI